MAWLPKPAVSIISSVDNQQFGPLRQSRQQIRQPFRVSLRVCLYRRLPGFRRPAKGCTVRVRVQQRDVGPVFSKGGGEDHGQDVFPHPPFRELIVKTMPAPSRLEKQIYTFSSSRKAV